MPLETGNSARIIDSNGWAEIKGNPISRVGVFPYSGRQIDSSLDPDKIYQVYRPEEELSSQACIDSFKLLPWVDLHPNRLLGSEADGRMPAEEKGIEGVIGEDVYFENGILYGNLKLFSDHMDGKIDDGVRELSAGYGCIYELVSGVFNGQPYDAIQRNIRGNHLALVPEGRMGPEVAVLDKLTFTFDAKEIKMAKTEEEKNEENLKGAADRAAKDGFKKYMADEEDPEEKAERKEAGAKDAEPEEKEEPKKEKKAEDKKAKDSDEEGEKQNKAETKKEDKEARSGLDSAMKSLFVEVKRRDTLASRLSSFVGSFDASEMTASEVASYGIQKLGIKAPKGQEMAALDGFMHGRTAPADEIGYALDTNSGKKADLEALFNKKAN